MTSSLLKPPRGGHDAASIERIGEALLGPLEALYSARVVHVTAVHTQGGRLTTMRIGPQTPRSPHDFFVLNFMRAHADVIVSTLKNLRDEPQLSFDLQGADSLPTGLQRYRREILQKPDAPRLVLLSRTGDVDLAHPALQGRARAAIVVPTGQADALTDRIGHAGLASAIAVWPRADTHLRAIVEELQTQPDIATVSIEAGPSTSRALYDAPCLVGALALCRFEGETVPDGVVGGELLDPAALDAVLPGAGPRHQVSEDSGPWSFQLRRRD